MEHSYQAGQKLVTDKFAPCASKGKEWDVMYSEYHILWML